MKHYVVKISILGIEQALITLLPTKLEKYKIKPSKEFFFRNS